MNDSKDLEVSPVGKFQQNTTNKKELYWVIIENVASKPKTKLYLATRADKDGPVVSIQGYEIPSDSKTTQIKDKLYNDAIEWAKQSGDEFETIAYSWSRVVSIKTIKLNVK